MVGELVEKGGYVLGAERRGVFAGMELMVSAHPLEVGLFGARTQMPQPESRPRPISQADGGGIGGWRARSRHWTRATADTSRPRSLACTPVGQGPMGHR